MSTIFVFGEYRLDPARRELTRAGAPRPVEPQVLDLLLALDDDAFDIVELEILASPFRLVLVEPGEASAWCRLSRCCR